MEYVTYNEAGKLTGGYSQPLQPEHSTCHIEVTQIQRESWTKYQANPNRSGLESYQAPIVPPPIPQVVPMRSARLVMLQAGILDIVQNYIDSMTGIEGEAARINWEFALTVNRDDSLVKQLIPALGKTEAQIDQMFIDASFL